MSATRAGRNLTKSFLLVLGGSAVVAGAILTSFGLYRELASGGDTSVPSLASQHRTDPGGIYDRPLGVVRAPAATPEPVVAAVPEPPLPEAAYHIIIDKIGVNAAVFPYGVDANRVPEVPLNADDVAWYNFSAPPGTGSNAVFAAHVTWNGRAVFYDLKEVQIGDSIVLRGDNGTEIAYVVSDSFLVDPNDPNALSVMAPTPADVITIITCDGSFYRTSDPVFGGDYTNRRVVRATFSRLTQPVAAVGG
ncbi:MAG: class F sortase [Chloroflexi bacterium]|nr:MAG: class F sortase [Chloroflexota bacterium]